MLPPNANNTECNIARMEDLRFYNFALDQEGLKLSMLTYMRKQIGSYVSNRLINPQLKNVVERLRPKQRILKLHANTFWGREYNYTVNLTGLSITRLDSDKVKLQSLTATNRTKLKIDTQFGNATVSVVNCPESQNNVTKRQTLDFCKHDN